jgi:hypothetical protein
VVVDLLGCLALPSYGRDILDHLGQLDLRKNEACFIQASLCFDL